MKSASVNAIGGVFEKTPPDGFYVIVFGPVPMTTGDG